MKTSWKRLLSCFAFFGITWGAWTVAQAGQPSFIKTAPKFGSVKGSQNSQGSQGTNVVKKTPTLSTPPVVTTPKPPVKVVKPPLSVLNPGNVSPVKPLPPITKPPKVIGPINPFPPVVTNPPGKPPKVTVPIGPFPPIVTTPPGKPPIIVDPIHPFPPIGPIKPPVKPPIVIDPIHPFPPIGPIKPPVKPPIDPTVPPVVVDPVIDPTPPVTPPVTPTPCPPPPHHCHPIWPVIVDTIINGGGYGPGPIVVQPYPIGGGVVTVPTTPAVVTVPAVETTTTLFDLELLDVRFVDDGLAADQGPRYRVTVRNLSRSDLVGAVGVVLMASAEATPAPGAQHVLGSFENLPAGASQTVDVRLPAEVARQRQAFGFLTAAVALSDGSVDANPADNFATFDRTSIRDVDLRLDNLRNESGRLFLVGEGFGPAAGKLLLKIGAEQYTLPTANWRATEIGIVLPAEAAGSESAELQLIKADGRTGPPLEIRFAAK